MSVDEGGIALYKTEDNNIIKGSDLTLLLDFVLTQKPNKKQNRPFDLLYFCEFSKKVVLTLLISRLKFSTFFVNLCKIIVNQRWGRCRLRNSRHVLKHYLRWIYIIVSTNKVRFLLRFALKFIKVKKKQ